MPHDDRWASDLDVVTNMDHALLGRIRAIRAADPEQFGPLSPRPEGGRWPWEQVTATFRRRVVR